MYQAIWVQLAPTRAARSAHDFIVFTQHLVMSACRPVICCPRCSGHNVLSTLLSIAHTDSQMFELATFPQILLAALTLQCTCTRALHNETMSPHQQRFVPLQLHGRVCAKHNGSPDVLVWSEHTAPTARTNCRVPHTEVSSLQITLNRLQ